MAAKNRTRVDSKLYPDFSSTFAREFLDDAFPGQETDAGSIPRPLRGLGSLRRCAATRDLTSISANVNYSALVKVWFMIGDPGFISNFQTWHLITVPFSDHNNTSHWIEIEVQNLDTVRRFKSDLCHQLFPNASTMKMDEDRWPETSLYRKQKEGGGDNNDNDDDDSLSSLELIQDFEALYSFGLADGDELILLLHNTDQDRRLSYSFLFDATISSSSSLSPAEDPIARWIESVRRQEFEQITA